ncbi:TPA: S6 family peptidase [Escherichia coli]
MPYQTFRDFAENKGVFTPGATGIENKRQKWKCSWYA